MNAVDAKKKLRGIKRLKIEIQRLETSLLHEILARRNGKSSLKNMKKPRERELKDLPEEILKSLVHPAPNIKSENVITPFNVNRMMRC